MEPAHHLGVFTRHWPLLAGCFLAALVLGWALTPSRSGPAVDAWESALTVVPAPGSGDIVKLDVVKALATSEQVTASAAKRLRRTDLAGLEARVKIDADAEAGVLTITATGPTQEESEAVADAFGKAVVDGYRSNLRRSALASADEHRKQLKSLGDRITEVQGAADTATGARRTQLRSQLDALNTQYSELYSTIAQLDQTASTPVLEPFGGIDSASGDESVLSAPDSRAARLALAAGLGLALGLVAALMLDRLDTRVRGRAQAEEAFGFPAALVVRADEVLDRARKHADVVLVDSSPLFTANDAYDLVSHADTVLLTARSGSVTPEQAGRVSELLARTGGPVAGTALTASPGSPGGAGWAARRPYGSAAPPAVTPLPSLGAAPGGPAPGRGALPRHARDETGHPSPSWALGRHGRSPRAEGDDR